MIVKCKKLFPDAEFPQKTHDTDAGYDLTVHRVEEMPNRVKVFFGIALQPQDEYYFILAARSSISNRGMLLHNGIGVLDNGYLGEISAVMLKTDKFIMPKKGDRLVQIIPQQMIGMEIIEVSELVPTARGENGFGSSGI